MKLMKKFAALAACIGFVAAASTGGALTIGDSRDLGYIQNGIPAGDADVASYVNYLIDMAANTTATALGQTFYRSSATPGTLPDAVLATRATYSSDLPGSTVSINLGTGGFLYLLAKYDGPNYGTEVWYVGGLSGLITIPDAAGGRSGSKYGISGTSLFSGSTTPGENVPDGGTTALLLGATLSGVALLRRKLA
jgi:hypothetical protein